MTVDDLVLGPASQSDLTAIAEIEACSFREPWPEGTFAAELTRPIARLVCARSAGRVIGYSNYWIVADEASLLAIAVAPDYRGRKVASALVDELVGAARQAACTRVWLEVRASNAVAIALYDRCGFARVHVRRAYYADGEDAVVMARPLAADQPGPT